MEGKPSIHQRLGFMQARVSCTCGAVWIVEIQVTQELYLFLLHVLVGSGLGEGSVDCGVRAVLCQKKKKKIAIRWADRWNNKHGGLERRLNKYKGRETGRKRGQIRCWIVEFIVRRTAPSPTTREPRDDPPLFFFCSEKTVFASFQWWHKHCIVAALKSFLSNDTCSLAFLSNKRSF